jgi:hypothetical protein
MCKKIELNRKNGEAGSSLWLPCKFLVLMFSKDQEAGTSFPIIALIFSLTVLID